MGNSMLLQLLVRVGRYRDKGQLHMEERQPVSDERIKRMLTFLENHLSEELSVEFLAEQFFISKYHMMRLFRRETGTTIHGYLTERRLIAARELMAGGMSATDACFRSGWRSYCSFTRAWGKRFGSTPTGRRDTAAPAEEMYE